MAESFENLGSILQKGLVEALNRYEKQEEQRKKYFVFENDSEKNTRAASVGG